MTGHFLGFESLVEQVFICETSRDDIQDLMMIGTSLVRTCKFDLEKLVDASNYPKNANIFYELFLEDYNGDLIDVPVLNTNMKCLDNGECND